MHAFWTSQALSRVLPIGQIPGINLDFTPDLRKNLVGLAAEQEIEVFEDAVDLFAERLIEIGHRPAAELEALGRILGRPAGLA